MILINSSFALSSDKIIIFFSFEVLRTQEEMSANRDTSFNIQGRRKLSRTAERTQRSAGMEADTLNIIISRGTKYTHRGAH